MKPFSVATFNVHMWCDANHTDNYEQVRDLVKVGRTVSFICYFFKAKKNGEHIADTYITETDTTELENLSIT
jgi:hypothetical protein